MTSSRTWSITACSPGDWVSTMVQAIRASDRYHLMNRAIAAIAKSGTVTLELALFNVPTVCCYQTGAVTRWWAKNILKLKPRFFALPNILTGQEAIPECILPPVTPHALAHALRPYVNGEKKLACDLGEKLRFQIDASGDVGANIAQAITNVMGTQR